MQVLVTFVLAVVLAPIFGLIAAFPAAWGLMLAVGIVHAQLLTAVIPAGYWAIWPLAYVIVTIGIGLIGATS